jgi:hypothetical protein
LQHIPFNAINADWENLKAVNLQLTPTESFARHTKLAESILRLLDLIADVASVILHDDVVRCRFRGAVDGD